MSKEGDRLFFIAVKPMFAHLHKQRDYGLTQSCNLQTKLENTSEYSVLCESESCSEEGIDVLPNKFERDHLPLHTPSIFY